MKNAIVSIALALILGSESGWAFLSFPRSHLVRLEKVVSSSSLLRATTSENGSRSKKRRKDTSVTLEYLTKRFQKNPEAFMGDKGKKKRKRTRKRVEDPKQTYLYASQRKKLRLKAQGKPKSKSRNQEKDAEKETTRSVEKNEHSDFNPIFQAKNMGLVNSASQHCDLVLEGAEPKIIGRIRVDQGETSASFAYIIQKPAGWSILGKSSKRPQKKGNKAKAADKKETVAESPKKATAKKSPTPKPAPPNMGKEKDDKKEKAQKLTVPPTDVEGDVGLEELVDEMTPEELEELVDEMTPEELEELEAKITKDLEGGATDLDFTKFEDFILSEQEKLAAFPDSFYDDDDDDDKDEKADMEDGVKVKIHFKKDGKGENIVFQEDTFLSLMTPTERNQFLQEGEYDSISSNSKRIVPRKEVPDKEWAEDMFVANARPSIVNWLKDKKAAEGNPIRGGNFWVGIAGATNVDDTGLVLVCPRENIQSLFVDSCKYIAVVGNGNYFAPPPKNQAELPQNSFEAQSIAKLRKGRFDDSVLGIGVNVVDQQSTCDQVVQLCQTLFQDGIRGDPAANPFDRRAPRRLVHCDAISVSSLGFDEETKVKAERIPDDIAIMTDRRNHHGFAQGTFLGRSQLRDSPSTNAYREINAAGDGFPGWTVDRYDKWLVVQHDDRYPRGPLPSIHDGKTAGVYYLNAGPNRGAMGSGNARPVLLEGQSAPEFVPIQENGVKYLVSLDKDLSTGMFLDQRPQRLWLKRNCEAGTRVLNCFAHCGAFSIAAASAGASTVSLDLNKKWLDRIQPQMELNGIDSNDQDCIYGDCFDWLARLGRRQEKYDIVILDPPSSSIGTKKKRWSVKKDMTELVTLAAALVKKGGLLWTTTNSASIQPLRFARMCKKGLEEARLPHAKLERVVPMPVDFSSIGPAPVKNLVWRIL